jgi:hypothetical protein
MALRAEYLKELASTLPLRNGSPHERLRKLIIRGFFDKPKTTDELTTEIRQTIGTRLPSNVVQTYMKKFMDKGIIRVLRSERYHGNYWVLASEHEVKAAQRTLQYKNGDDTPALSPIAKAKTAELSSLAEDPLLEAKIKILFLAANPAGTSHLALDQECREIEQKIRASEHRDAFEFVTKWAVRTGDLLQYLNQHRAHIIHFSGHGSSAKELILLDAEDRPKAVSKRALKQLFETLKDNIRVVLLNACYSRPQAKAITDVIDCAIGMDHEIGDEAAVVFSAAFYQAIGFGRSVKDAFESGKTALMLEGIPETKTPKLLVRDGVDPSDISLIASVRRSRDRRDKQ